MGTEEPEFSVPTLSLRDFIQVLRRRKTTALITFVVVVGLVALMTALTKSQYISNASLMLEDQGRPPSASELADIFSPQSGMDVDSQVQLIASPLILNKVYEQSKVPPGSVALSVSRVEKTNVIQIAGVSNSPAEVQTFVSTVPEVYQENRRAENAREVISELNFAKKDLSEENQKLLNTEAAIMEFKNKNGLINPDAEANAALDRASTRKSSLTDVRADISSLRAQIQALQSDLDALPPFVNTPTVTTNPLLQDLNNQLAALQSERKEKSFLYKDNADPIRQIDLQIATLQARIASTAPTVTNNSRVPNPAIADTRNRVAGLRADLSAKEAAAQVLAAQSIKLEQGLSRYTDIQRQQSQLGRDLDASQTAVKAGKEKVRLLSVRAKALEAAGAPITVLMDGTPGVKVAPKPSRNIILGLFVGALLACVAALVQDSLDDRVRDEEEARQLLGAPVLGYFPLLSVSDERQILDMDNPDRLLLETFRALRSNVQFALVNSTGKKLQITSTVPNEGKSYIASNLAITMALDGRRVILVDTDLHRPTMHERFSASRQPGLTNVLVGENSVEEALQDVGIKGLQLMSAGALPPNPAELLNSPAMVEVMQELEAMADLVIFDTPPLLATSDSQLMSAKMDGVIFVMQMGSVARSGTARAFELLQQAHANLIGIVFNKVDATQNSVAYENYSGYYALESHVSSDEILIVPSKTLPPAEATSSNGSHQNGKSGHSENGTANGSGHNGSPEQATVFDDALQSDENSR